MLPQTDKLSLTHLPTELVLSIGGYLENSSLNSFIQTNKLFARGLTPTLYDDEIQFRMEPLKRLEGCDPSCRFYDLIYDWQSDIILDYFRTRPLEALTQVDGLGTPLFHLVVEQSNLKLATIFIRKGVDVDSRDPRGRTLLLKPEIYDLHQSLAIALVDAGANLMAATANGKVAILRAAKHAPAAVVERMIRKLKNAQGTPDTSEAILTPRIIDQMLCQAIFFGDMKKIQLLLDHGANPSSVCDGITPLMQAISRAHTPAINLLLDLGADTSLAGTEGATVLSASEIVSCDEDTVKRIVKAVVDAGGDLSAGGSCIINPDPDYDSESSDYVGEKDWEDANPNTLHIQATPLHRFMSTKNFEIVKLLINNGADILQPSDMGYSPLRMSLSTLSCTNVQDPLQEEIFRFVIHNSTTRPDFDGSRFFIDEQDTTFLHDIDVLISTDLTRLVIDSSRGPDGKIGIDLMAGAELEGTAIYLAMTYGYEDTAEVLFYAMKEQGCGFSSGISIPDDPFTADAGEIIPYPEYARQCKLERMEQLLRDEIESK